MISRMICGKNFILLENTDIVVINVNRFSPEFKNYLDIQLWSINNKNTNVQGVNTVTTVKYNYIYMSNMNMIKN